MEEPSKKLKLVAEEELESEHFDFLVRVQPTCSDSRPDTYFAVERNSLKRVFVKGPYADESAAQIPIRIFKLKKLLFSPLHSIEVRLVQLLPDLFPNVPLGVRRKIDRNRPHFFIVSDCLLRDSPLPTKEHETKKWGKITVVDWGAAMEPKTPNPLRLDSKSMQDWILNLLFRFAVGIPDPADRNFMMMRDGTIYATDEEGIGCTTNFANALKKKRCELIRKHVSSHSESVLSVTLSWLKAVRENEASVKEILGQKDITWLIDRLNELQTVKGINKLF